MKEKGCCGYMECWDQVSAQIASLSFEYAQLTNGGQLYTGKTFLLGTIVNHAMTISPTAFVFLDHDHNISSHTSALTVAHSFIFQLAIQNDNLQDIVRQSAGSQLKNTLNVAVNILKDVLYCAGRVFLIIDGMDEIDEIERSRFLGSLLELSRDCHETRILVSSRQDVVISRLLQGSAMSIHVNQRETGSVQNTEYPEDSIYIDNI